MKLITLVIFLSGSIGLATIGIDSRSSDSQEVPKAFKDDYLSDSFTKGRYGKKAIIDQLFIEAIENDIKLKTLYEELITINAAKHNALEDFNAYRTNTLNYFSEANRLSTSLNDEVLKKRAMEMLHLMQDSYTESISELKSKEDIIDEYEAEVNDRHTLLKLITSMQMMEDYQSRNLPKAAPVDEMIIRYEVLKTDLETHLDIIPEG